MRKNGLLSVIFLVVLALLLSLAGCAAPGPAVGANTGNPQSGEPASNTGGDLITAEEAQNIALEHAGFSADQVTGLRAEYDLDDGVPVYEVDFRQDRWEYEYEIHAETGEIRSYDRDD